MSRAIDPRVRRSKATAINAATNLLIEGGLRGLTFDAVAARSGVAKTTLYRHWQTREELLHDVIETQAPPVSVPNDSDDVAAMLREVMRSIAAAFRDPIWGRLVPVVLLQRRHDPSVVALDSRLQHERQKVLHGLLERAAREGLIEPFDDPVRVEIDLLGPLVFAHLTETVTLDDAYADRVVRRFLDGHRPIP